MSESLNSHPDNTDSDDDSDDALGITRVAESFEQVVDRIAARVQELAAQALQSAQDQQIQVLTTTAATNSSSSGVAATADSEIAALSTFLRQCDEFDLDLQKIAQIAQIVSDFRARIERAESFMDAKTIRRR